MFEDCSAAGVVDGEMDISGYRVWDIYGVIKE
jgi:hypothetical protein